MYSCTVEPQKLASPVISKLVLHFSEMLSILLVLDFSQRCLFVHTCLVCLSPIADPDHLSDLMSDTASAVHHADLPMSATLSPRRPPGDIARECVEAIVGGDSSQMGLR